MGKAYVTAYMDWFRSARVGVAIVAVGPDGLVLGYVVGAPLGYARAMSRELSRVAARAVLRRPWLFFYPQFRHGFLERLGFLLGRSQASVVLPQLPVPTMSLVAIGVSRAARGRSIGTRLVRAFEARAAELKMQSLRLSTQSGNTAACRLYERCGWSPHPAADGLTYYFKIPSVEHGRPE
jgi:ribosomal protein S18 acetylase RimI-like enzyme